MTERDLPLKLTTGQWFWSLGSAVLFRVRLSTFKALPARGKSSILELTDLDVLGVEVAPDFRLRYRIAECKSGKVGALELFWLRGVVDFFGATDPYLIVGKEQDRSPAMRHLAGRLGLGILSQSDLTRLTETQRVGSAAGLFDAASIERLDSLLATTPGTVKDLSDYVRRLFWQLPLHRNLEYGISYLEQARAGNPRDRGMLCLIGEHAIRYCLALFAACEALLRRGLPDIRGSLPGYLFGSEQSLREAQQRVRALKELQKKIEGNEREELAEVFDALPPYYDQLLELITRLLRRPDQATAMLRTLQAVTVGSFANSKPITELIGEPGPLTTKLVLDVISFLVKAADLSPSVVTAFESALQGDTGNSAGHLTETTAASVSESNEGDGERESESRRTDDSARRREGGRRSGATQDDDDASLRLPIDP